MNLQELKRKTPAELILQAEKLEIENPSTLRKQEILFAILKKLAQKNEQITGGGVLEVLQDGFGFLPRKSSWKGQADTCRLIRRCRAVALKFQNRVRWCAFLIFCRT